MFIDQCKQNGVDFDKLNTGWVDQHKLDEEKDDTEEIDDDDDEDDDIIDEEELFRRRSVRKSRPDSRSESKHESKSSHKSLNTTTNDGQEVTFKFGKKDTEPKSVDKNDDKSKSADRKDSTSHQQGSNRERIENALNDADINVSKPKIKLNIDKTSVNHTQSNEKPKLKLNIKPKQ